MAGRIGLIAGNGALPRLFARAARAKGLAVFAVGHVGETDPELASEVERLDWVKVGQVGRIERLLRDQGVTEAVLAGGFSRMRAVQQLRPDLGMFRVAARLRSFRDDALLRAAADEFQAAGIRIIATGDLTDENVIDGLVITFADITIFKEQGAGLRHAVTLAEAQAAALSLELAKSQEQLKGEITRREQSEAELASKPEGGAGR